MLGGQMCKAYTEVDYCSKHRKWTIYDTDGYSIILKEAIAFEKLHWQKILKSSLTPVKIDLCDFICTGTVCSKHFWKQKVTAKIFEKLIDPENKKWLLKKWVHKKWVLQKVGAQKVAA
jgi:hypothetical protein